MMTNQKKFEEVFGFPYSHLKELPKVWLFEEYKKCKHYKAIMCDRKKVVDVFYVYAKNKKDARNKAIEILGNRYARFSGSGVPIYSLKIWPAEENDWDQVKGD